MKSRLIGAALIAAVTLLVVHQLNPNARDGVAIALAASSPQPTLPAKTEAFLETVAPLADPEKLVACTDLGQPGIIIGRFCRHFGSHHVNLRMTETVPVTALRQLPNLTKVEAHNAKWDSLEPLVEFSNLNSLNLWDARIGNVSALAKLSALETLELRNSGITNLTLLSNLSQLRVLSLAELQITDLTPLQGLTGLQELYLQETPVIDLSPLAEMRNLQVLDIRNTGVSDLTPLDGIAGLSIRQ